MEKLEEKMALSKPQHHFAPQRLVTFLVLNIKQSLTKNAS